MLRVRDLGFAYPGQDAVLRSVTLDVPAGSNAFLLGPSGVGKSTLLRCIAGLEQPLGGEVWWNDQRLDGLPPHARHVGMLFQEPALFPHLRVWQNVAFALRYRRVPRAAERTESMPWLQMVGLEGRDGARVDELSGGQRQRVALARTLAAQPRVVLLDEPFSALDRELRDDLGMRVTKLLAGQGVAALWVTHDRDEAGRLGDALWELKEGTCRGMAR
jgi:ABC-type Fe3+/spermidine/putrescine transport system ATPase subunit